MLVLRNLLIGACGEEWRLAVRARTMGPSLKKYEKMWYTKPLNCQYSNSLTCSYLGVYNGKYISYIYVYIYIYYMKYNMLHMM